MMARAWLAAATAAFLACAGAQAQQRIEGAGLSELAAGGIDLVIPAGMRAPWPTAQWCENSQFFYKIPADDEWSDVLDIGHFFGSNGVPAPQVINGNDLALRKRDNVGAKPLLLIVPFCEPHDIGKVTFDIRMYRRGIEAVFDVVYGHTGAVIITKIAPQGASYRLNGYFFHRYAKSLGDFSGNFIGYEVHSDITRFENLSLLDGSSTLFKNICHKQVTFEEETLEENFRLLAGVFRNDREFTMLSTQGEICTTSWKLRDHEDIIAVGILGLTSGGAKEYLSIDRWILKSPDRSRALSD